MSGKSIRDALGFVGVIASLVFVGVEIQQSAAATRGATQQELQMAAITVSLASANDAGLAELLYRFQTDTSTVNDVNLMAGFTGGETRQIRNYFLAVFRLYEEAYYQYALGNLEPSIWTAWESNIQLVIGGYGGQLWPLLSRRYSESFRTYIDEVIRTGSAES